jgi:hypothetical protein
VFKKRKGEKESKQEKELLEENGGELKIEGE